MDAQEALEIRRRQILERLNSESVQIQPGYFTAREEIMRPDRMETETAYFWDNWAPRLGPSATMLIVRMRHACRRAGDRSEQDAAITLSYQELARYTGMSVSTIKRLLNQDEVRRFIRKEAQMRESAIGMVDAPNRYVVMMTDPLTEEDEVRLRTRLADRLLTQELLGQPGRAVQTPETPQRAVQNDPVPGVQNDLPPQVHNEPATKGQIEPVSVAQSEPVNPRRRASVLTSKVRNEPPPAPVLTENTAMQNVKTHEEQNVNNVLNNGLPYINTEAVEGWALRMVEATGDEKSLNFYRKAARILLQRNAEGVLDHALGIVKEAMREGKARRPAALLTSSLLTLAEERGIFITDRSRNEAQQVRNLISKNLTL